MSFNIYSPDPQATEVEPVSPGKFDLQAYMEYEEALLENCEGFRNRTSGILVHRRIRSGEVFRDVCKDMKVSLAYQLGALQKSMLYKADIPNFLEPWYGIGTIASAFGIEYIWEKGQAPAFKGPFKSIQEALDYPAIAVKDTQIGKYTLETIEYFLEKTKGQIPISLTDCQSPLNIVCGLVDINYLFMELYDSPELFKKLIDKVTDLLIDFTNEQLKLLKDVVVFPGHGFASTRCFEGLGVSDDYSLMLSSEHYKDFAVPALEKLAEKFNGIAYHSCGNWGKLAETVKTVKGLKTVDGAFSTQTDPAPNNADDISEVFTDSGVVINARAVGNCDDVIKIMSKLNKKPVKIIAVTYCQDLDEQQELYEKIHQLSD